MKMAVEIGNSKPPILKEARLDGPETSTSKFTMRAPQTSTRFPNRWNASFPTNCLRPVRAFPSESRPRTAYASGSG